MIIEDMNSFPIIDTKLVDLWPSTKEDSEGTLRCGVREYPVRVTHDPDWRVWARVVVAKGLGSADTEGIALKVAAKGLSNDIWRPLCVDVRDGETLYSTTLTYDMTSEAMDRFFDQAIRFLTEYGSEVDAILGRDAFEDDTSLDMSDLDLSDLSDLF